MEVGGECSRVRHLFHLLGGPNLAQSFCFCFCLEALGRMCFSWCSTRFQAGLQCTPLFSLEAIGSQWQQPKVRLELSGNASEPCRFARSVNVLPLTLRREGCGLSFPFPECLDRGAEIEMLTLFLCFLIPRPGPNTGG